jgi:hypothetical protein|tara:strand:- start:346 stop:642 length:297 start_codon:yes stop_codon:yes gene_type:complete
MKMEDIPAGESWACRFKTTTFIDKESRLAVQDKNLAVGQAHKGIPGDYESIGLIQIRDVANSIVQLLDTVTDITFKVDFKDCWDIEEVEWINEPTELA